MKYKIIHSKTNETILLKGNLNTIQKEIKNLNLKNINDFGLWSC